MVRNGLKEKQKLVPILILNYVSGSLVIVGDLVDLNFKLNQQKWSRQIEPEKVLFLNLKSLLTRDPRKR